MFDRRKGPRGTKPIDRVDAFISHGGGRAQVISLHTGLYEVRYSGVVGDDTFAFLRAEVLRSTQDAKSLMLDMTRVLSTATVVPHIPIGTYSKTSPPGVVICRDDQIEVWRKYSVDTARHGVKRAVFPEALRDLALSMAQTLAGAASL